MERRRLWCGQRRRLWCGNFKLCLWSGGGLWCSKIIIAVKVSIIAQKASSIGHSNWLGGHWRALADRFRACCRCWCWSCWMALAYRRRGLRCGCWYRFGWWASGWTLRKLAAALHHAYEMSPKLRRGSRLHHWRRLRRHNRLRPVSCRILFAKPTAIIT